MMHLGNRRSGEWYMSIHPFVIRKSDTCEFCAYVYDICGNCYYLTFDSREKLIEAMKALCNHGSVTCRCDCELIVEPQRTSQHNYQDRELQFNDELEMEIER